MAKKRRLKYVCEFCQKRYSTPQAKYGHYARCAKRNLSQEVASQPEAEAPSPEPRRPGPDSQEMKLLLLDAHEGVIELQNDAVDYARGAQWLARTAASAVEGHATPKEWLTISQDLGAVEREFDQMVGPLRLDRSLLFKIYHWMFPIQNAWLAYRAQDFSRGGDVTSEGEKVLREERALFADLLLKIKRMLVAAR